LNPQGVGTGGGSGSYNTGQQAIIGIEPPTGGATYNMGLNNYVTPSASSIGYGQAFTVSTNIANSGTNTFSGDYCAAVFDNQNNFIDYVQILTGYSLQGGYTYQNNLVFSNSGLVSMLPGSYQIYVYYRPTGGNWVQVNNNGNYINSASINVVNTNSIQLNSNMVVSSNGVFVQNQSASVNVNIINDGANTFTGQYQVNLYGLDGSFVETINTISENSGLPSNYTYLAPYLTFNTSSISAAPGSYLLAVLYKPNSSSTWQLAGSSYFQNPIIVTVQAQPLQPDQYETNNTVAQSKLLSLSFSNNTAFRGTLGSNLHIQTDNDYYKIQLPTGFDYTINARLHDAYNSGNGNAYTCDALFSYSLNGTNWSGPYDDLMSGNISVPGGGTLYFHVAPFFAGETGTYFLDMAISRTVPVSTQEVVTDEQINVFPNPASSQLNIDLGELSEVNQIQVINLQGQVLSVRQVLNNETMVILPVENYPNGVYFIRISTDTQVITKKAIIQR
jgi:hypothetical protein